MTTNSRDVSSHYVRKWLRNFARPTAFADLLEGLHHLRELADTDIAETPSAADIDRAIRDVENASAGILVD